MKQNWKNRTMWTGDNLPILRGMNSESVDLIYLDPPFNSNRDYSAPIGSEAAGAAFKDTWTLEDVDEAWHGEIAEQNPAVYSIIDAAGLAHGSSMKSYLIMMAVRLLEMQRILKETGSLQLHCDPTASHYLKLLLDAVFGTRNFINEIVWYYRGAGVPKKSRARRHDTILWFTKQVGGHFFDPDPIRTPYADTTQERFKHYIGNVRQNQDYGQQTLNPKGKHPDDVIAHIQPVAPSAKERVGYPTQKPLPLLDNLISSSSKPGDIVLDPFAGCATACVAAERLGRQWVGIDISEKAADLVQVRIRKEIDLFHNFKPIRRSDIPRRTDLGKLPSYRTHKHLLFGKQEGHCAGCKVSFQFRNLTVDHVTPQSHGGTDHMDNLQLLCGACNSMKGTGTQAELIVKLQAQELR